MAGGWENIPGSRGPRKIQKLLIPRNTPFSGSLAITRLQVWSPLVRFSFDPSSLLKRTFRGGEANKRRARY